MSENCPKHRSKCRIFADLLRAIQASEEARTTYLIHEANLPHNRFIAYIAQMERKGLIIRIASERDTVYSISEKGKRYLHEFKKFEEFGDIFGVEI